MNETEHNHEDHPSDAEAQQTEADAQAAAEHMPAFSPQRLRWELGRDAAMRWAVIGAVIVLAVSLVVWNPGTIMVSLAMALLAVGAWAALSLTSTRATQRLPEITALMERNPAAAESALAQTLTLKPMLRWVRLVLYQRLATLRHRQGGYAESAGICQTLLIYTVGPAAQSRAPLLLMLCEARLECHDLLGAYYALTELHYTRLSLPEALQRLALQTRYEVKTGQHTAALHDSQRKIRMAELMPAAQCGAVHALLAEAAASTDQNNLAHWLWNRTLLLCTAEQVERVKRGGSIGDVAAEFEPAG